MMRKLAQPGYRVAPMYADEPSGTIVSRVDDTFVLVAWDAPRQHGKGRAPPEKEYITYLRKGSPSIKDSK